VRRERLEGKARARPLVKSTRGKGVGIGFCGSADSKGLKDFVLELHILKDLWEEVSPQRYRVPRDFADKLRLPAALSRGRNPDDRPDRCIGVDDRAKS